MGLDFSHCGAHWAYSGFNRFRTNLAKSIGLTLDEMEGFGGTVPWSTVDDKLKILLDHSDCDGYITPKKALILADRLEQILPELEKLYSDPHIGMGRADYDLAQARLLIEGLRLAGQRKERFKFC